MTYDKDLGIMSMQRLRRALNEWRMDRARCVEEDLRCSSWAGSQIPAQLRSTEVTQ